MTALAADELDRRFLAAAVRLGAGALGTTWPNPAVGAILVKDGRVLGRGRTARGGRPHGETLALAQAGAEARGATLYVSLEPCAHYGRTPPCADASIEAGIARAVAPAADPDPRVAGRGFGKLREAGLQVVVGPLAAEAARAHAGHIRRVSAGRPHVTLKLAVSADDAIGRRGEGGVAVTGAIARRHVQALRSQYDAILVGRGTIEADDPQLTCRLPGLEHRSPVRVILDSGGRLGRDRRVFSAGQAPTWVVTGSDAAESGPPTEVPVRRVLPVQRGPDGRLDLRAMLRRLAEEGITRLLAEGGATVARSLLEADLADEILLFRSRERLGGELVPALDGLPLAAIETSLRYRVFERRSFGSDSLTRYARVS